mmetsp:Transcript_32225/g.69274  ORF Transcript_32225/g.69274 Transcript_32225/m.69274 type:complete len:279 (+) Transcript_32225:954-1790(+)
MGWDDLAGVRHLLGGRDHPQGARHATLLAARRKGLVHHAQRAAQARGVHRRHHRRVTLRGGLYPAVDAVGHLLGADGHHVHGDAHRHRLLDPRQPADPQGAALRAAGLWYRPALDARPPQVPHVPQPRSLHRALRLSRDGHPRLLHRTTRDCLLALHHTPPAHGAGHRHRHRLLLSRAALQRALPAGAAGGHRAGRSAPSLHHHCRGARERSGRSKPDRVAAVSRPRRHGAAAASDARCAQSGRRGEAPGASLGRHQLSGAAAASRPAAAGPAAAAAH